jgi:hypothetical protein
VEGDAHAVDAEDDEVPDHEHGDREGLVARRLDQVVVDGPAQLVVGVGQPLVGDHAVPPEEQEEGERRRGHRLPPGERRANRAASAEEEHGTDAREPDDQGHDEGDH